MLGLVHATINVAEEALSTNSSTMTSTCSINVPCVAGLFSHTTGGFGPGYWIWLLGATTVLGGIASLAQPPLACRLGSALGGGLGFVVTIDWLAVGRLAQHGDQPMPVLWPTTANLKFIIDSPFLVYSLLLAANVIAAAGYALQWRRQRHQAVQLAFKGRARSAGYLPAEFYYE